jgi:hypothetical protein
MTHTIHVSPTTHAGITSYTVGLRNKGHELTMGTVADTLWAFTLKKHREEFDEYMQEKLKHPYGDLL